MTEPMDRAEENALWRHWRAAVVNAAGEAAPAPDALLLAAYAEHRLSEVVAEEVEAWLALHPEAIEDVLAAADSKADVLAAVSEAAVARVGVAASLLVASLVGFALGTDAYTSLINGDQSTALSQDLFDPPSGVF